MKEYTRRTSVTYEGLGARWRLNIIIIDNYQLRAPAALLRETAPDKN